MKYLVEGQEQDTVIARNEAIPSLINHLEELTLIDPASGSGHILVTGFELLFKMYREQGYTAKNAAISILQNNLFGLDIDDRAMQLARFAVLLKAAEFYPEVLNASESNPLLLPHIYSFPENTIDYIFAPEAISVSRLKEYLGYQIAEEVIERWNEDFVDPDTGIVVTIERTKNIIDKWEKVDEEAIEILKEHNKTSVLISTYKPVSEFIETTEYNIVFEVAKALSLLRQGKNALRVSSRSG
jgi:hypothetical protein